ncbi:MAG: 23S rRNA pseudouridine(2604) synthase [Chlamydiae bacterium]|nr:23S rRNA pseudouridine(2604) synthase [Chlamydiota bacterium]
MDNKVRLSKLLSERGVCSRREADRYIERGEVLVDGQVVSTLGIRVAPDAKIALASSAQKKQKSKVTILLNKPIGYVSTQPEKGYKEAVELLPLSYRNLNTAGRLDIDSKGLLVLTEDGVLVKKLIGENCQMEKEYLVRVEGTISKEKIAKLKTGLFLDDKPLKPAKIDQLETQVLRFILQEGKKRQIRRMCEQVNLKAIGLKRVRIGRIMLGDLPEGKWRFLKPNERF